MNARQESKNQQAKINARNASRQQEVERQKVFQDANDVALQQTLQGFNKATVDQGFGDLIASREAAYADNAPAVQSFDAISENAPQVVKTDSARRVADQLGKSKAEAKALAKMGGIGDLFQNNGLAINNAANNIGTTNSIARGSLGANATEQVSAANNAGNKKSMWGDLLQAAGQAGTMYVSGGGLSPTGATGVTAANGGIPYDMATYQSAPITPVW
jgi:hypothetical protein